MRRFHGLSRKEAAKEDKQAQASEDAEEDALAAAAQVEPSLSPIRVGIEVALVGTSIT